MRGVVLSRWHDLTMCSILGRGLYAGADLPILNPRRCKRKSSAQLKSVMMMMTMKLAVTPYRSSGQRALHGLHGVMT